MKSYTDIPQSKKLAEFLLLESADMWWAWYSSPFNNGHYDDYPIFYKPTCNPDESVPCWSLSALLEQLKSEIVLENKQILFLHINKYNDIEYDIRYTNSLNGEVLITEKSNLVDCCVEMIEKLHELNLI